jgi:Flp pilus assembly CpaF family ATPase
VIWHAWSTSSDEVVGFGPIEFLLRDPGVTEVTVNGQDDVYAERAGVEMVKGLAAIGSPG